MVAVLEAAVPDRFVLIDTGDYLHPECSEYKEDYDPGDHFLCSVYDPHYRHWLVPMETWRKYEWLTTYLDQEWRTEGLSCKMSNDVSIMNIREF